MRKLAFKNYHTGQELQSGTRFLQLHSKLPTTLTRANFSVPPPYYWSFGLEVIMKNRKKEHFLMYNLTHNCCNGQNENAVFRGIVVGFKVTDWFFCLTRIPVNVVVSHSCQRRRKSFLSSSSSFVVVVLVWEFEAGQSALQIHQLLNIQLNYKKLKSREGLD